MDKLSYDASMTGIREINIFGFIGNILIAYLPYKLWNNLSAKKPNFRSTKKLGLFLELTAFSTICGLISGWGLLWLYSHLLSQQAS